jgi:hypothetical protein
MLIFLSYLEKKRKEGKGKIKAKQVIVIGCLNVTKNQSIKEKNKDFGFFLYSTRNCFEETEEETVELKKGIIQGL